MIRASIVSLSALTGLASAGTVNFVAQDASAARLSGVSTSAVLTADHATFTITLRNQTGSGSMTGFYIESGSALDGLGEATIANGSGVLFTQRGPSGGSSGAAGFDAASSAVSPSTGTVFGQPAAFESTLAANPFGTGWAGSFFGMTGRGDFGQASGEFVSVTFRHDGRFSLDNLLQSLANDDLRFIQVYDNYGDQGDSGYLSSALVVVPLPPAAWAGLGLLGAVAGARAIKKNRRD